MAHADKIADRTAPFAKMAREKGSDERFSETVEEIEAALVDSAADMKELRQQLKAKKEEIKALDVEIRRQFADTAKKVKEHRLTAEILERHGQDRPPANDHPITWGSARTESRGHSW